MPIITDELLFFLSLIALLVLSIYAVETCRRQKNFPDPASAAFLFSALDSRQSFAGNIGSMFSLTYFAGGLVIYGSLFRAWYILWIVVVFSIAPILIRRVILKVHRVVPEVEQLSETSNILLQFLSARLGSVNFKALIDIYALIYFGLLVEELAVSRLVLNALFPGKPWVPALLLIISCGVLVICLTLGGFRAALTVDYYQLWVLIPFLVALMFLFYRDSGAISMDILRLPSHVNPWILCAGSLAAVVFLVAWLVAPIDFYSRLNIHPQGGRSLKVEQLKLASVSLLSLFFLMCAGALFGAHLAGVVPAIESASTYTNDVIRYLTEDQTPALLLIFLVSVLCMIFTTLNTLMITLLQLGQSENSRWLSRGNLYVIVPVAAAFSARLNLEAVCIVGVFIGSLMFIPFVIILQEIQLPRWRIAAKEVRFYYLSLACSLVSFGLLYERLRSNFFSHYMIPSIVVLSALLALALDSLYRLFARRLRRDY